MKDETGGNVKMVTDDSESATVKISDGTRDILRFFSFVKPYFNPVSRYKIYALNMITLTSQNLISNHFSGISPMLVNGPSPSEPSCIICRMNCAIVSESWLLLRP